MTNDTNTTETASPAVEAVAVNNAAPVTTAPESAPDTTTTNNGNPEQASAESSKAKDGLPPGVKKRLWEQSEKIRKYEAELAKLQTPSATTPTPEAETVTDINLLDDPDKWAKSIEGKILSQAEKNILSRIEQQATEKRIVAEAQKAQEFIYSHAEFGTSEEPNEETRLEIQSIVATPEVQAVCKINPMKGAEYAMSIFKKAKGLDDATVAKANANAAKSGAPLPAGVTTGRKTWTAAQVDAYLKDFKSPEYSKRKAEILLAAKEGRII